MQITEVLGIKIHMGTLGNAVNIVCNEREKLQGEYITFINVHTLVLSKESYRYAKVQQEAAYRFADGYPIAKYQKKHGYRKAERIAGPDFMDEVFRISEERGYRHFFYGGDEKWLSVMEKNVKQKYPKLNIAGIYAPSKDINVENGDFEEDIQTINDAKPDFIWVGLGAPKQEFWMAKVKGKVCGMMLGVGAAFDFVSGRKKRAPKWMQKSGLEWFHRMIQEPGRLLPRYIRTNIKYAILCIKENKNE